MLYGSLVETKELVHVVIPLPKIFTFAGFFSRGITARADVRLNLN